MDHRDRSSAGRKGISRRQFNFMLSGAAMSPLVTPVFVNKALAQPTTFNESPMLAERVARGELPPVTERLPPKPLVVEPTNEIGTYGGRLNGAGMAPETTSDLQIGQATGLFRFSNDLSEIYPDLATGYEFNEDFTACTISLLPGVRWSDGAPFTTDDIVFFFEDMQFNADLYPSPQGAFLVGGEKIGVEKIDDYTVRFTFSRPNPSFAFIHYSGPPMEPYRPAHYLKQFHIKYNPNVEAEAAAAGYNSWQAYFMAKADGDQISQHYGASPPEQPVLSPWVPVSNDSQYQQYERNPYYYKVDTAGNQLPYVDYMTVEYATNAEVMNLKAVSGELSVAGLDIQLVNYPIIRRGEETGNYRTKLVFSERGADVAIAFNQLHPDPVLNALFTDVRFRQAMSLGINRAELNELVFLGQGTPRQATINESASFYDPAWGEAYAQHDVERANALLDELGLTERDANGIRLMSGGRPLQFQLEYLPQEGPKKETCELVVKHWAELGVQAEAMSRERAFLTQRLRAQEQHATAWHVDRVLERPAYAYTFTGKLGPGGGSAIQYAFEWSNWFNSGGANGVEPPEEAKRLRQLYVEWAQTEMGTPEYAAAAKAVFDLTAETLYVIGTIGQAPQPVIVRNDVGNVFKEGDDTRLWWGAANWFWHTLNPEQWYIKA